MSRGHGSSRRQAYGRRMKDLRTRRGERAEVNLEGPTEWTRGEAWDPDAAAPSPSPRVDDGRPGARPR